MYNTIRKKEAKTSMPPEEVIAWTREHCTIPTVGFFDFAIEDGLLCGVVEVGEEHGYEAGRMASAILEGTDMFFLPVLTATKGIRRINRLTAKKLNIVIPEDIFETTEQVVGAQ